MTGTIHYLQIKYLSNSVHDNYVYVRGHMEEIADPLGTSYLKCPRMMNFCPSGMSAYYNRCPSWTHGLGVIRFGCNVDFQKNRGDKEEENLDKIELGVPTFVQKYSWDCGLACVCMVLRFLGLDDTEIYKKDHVELDCKESVWTIDLAYLLQKYGIRNKLTTMTLGVNEGYGSSSYYKDSFTRDEIRINRLFQEAGSRGITVEKRSVEVNELMEHLKGGNLSIVLIDWSHLECIWCDKLGISCLTCFKGCSKCCSGYQGHYIVLCGFDKKKKRIFYKNPSYHKEMCCSRISNFNMARKSFGTDEDTLFIYCHK